MKLAAAAPGKVCSAALVSSAGFCLVSLLLVLRLVGHSLTKNTRKNAENLVKLLSPPDLPLDPFYVDFFVLILASKFTGEPVAPHLPDREIRQLTAPSQVLMGEYELSFSPGKAIRRVR